MSGSSTVRFPDQLDGLVTVLDLVRAGSASTRTELAQASGLGRNTVADRVDRLLESGLLSEGAPGASTGGRAARRLSFVADAGRILVAVLGATTIRVALADLLGNIQQQRLVFADLTDGPEPTLAKVDQLFDELLAGNSTGLWGIGISLPGPVEFATGRPVAPPIMPGWDGHDIRRHFATTRGVPVWVDNDVNVMMLGEIRKGRAVGQQDVVFIKVGSGIGAGLVSRGLLHRGAQGCAGDIGHINAVTDSTVLCRCGNVGCLEALAGGIAIARDATSAAREGRSERLAAVLAAKGELRPSDVIRAARSGDQLSIGLLSYSAHLVGESVARIVNLFNPSLILIGGQVTANNDVYLANVRRTVLGRSLPLATRSLEITTSALGEMSGVTGAVYMVVDELLSRSVLARWIDADPRELVGGQLESG